MNQSVSGHGSSLNMTQHLGMGKKSANTWEWERNITQQVGMGNKYHPTSGNGKKVSPNKWEWERYVTQQVGM